MKKLLFHTFLIYMACIGCIFLLNEIFIERQSKKDFEGFIVFSLVYLMVMVGCVYWPALGLIEKKFGSAARKQYPMLAAFVFNIPYFVFAIVMAGKAFQPSEALLFCGMFIVIGFGFGKFYRNYRLRKA
jgi:hypothetical protein